MQMNRLRTGQSGEGKVSIENESSEIKVMREIMKRTKFDEGGLGGAAGSLRGISAAFGTYRRSLDFMWIILTVFMVFFLFEGVSAAQGRSPTKKGEKGGELERGLRMLQEGARLCGSNDHEAGVKSIFQGAVTVQKANPSHPANRKWRLRLRKCLSGWIKYLGRGCKAEKTTLKRLQELEMIAQQARKVAEKGIAQRSLGIRSRCLRTLGAKMRKRCKEEPGPDTLELSEDFIKSLKKDQENLPAGVLKQIESAGAVCAEEWRKNAAMRCSAQPDIAVLKEMGGIVQESAEDSKPAAKKEFLECARALGRYGRQLCNNRRYLRGRKFLKEAVSGFERHGKKDDAFLKEMKDDWLSRCGRFASIFDGKAEVQTGSVKLNVKLDGHVIMEENRSKKNGVGLKGRLVLIPKVMKAESKEGEVNVSLSNVAVFLEGRFNPKTKNFVWWYKKSGGLPGPDSIQVNRPDKPAEVIRDTMTWDLVKAAKLTNFWMSTKEDSTKTVTFEDDLGGGRKAKLEGSWRIQLLE